MEQAAPEEGGVAEGGLFGLGTSFSASLLPTTTTTTPGRTAGGHCPARGRGLYRQMTQKTGPEGRRKKKERLFSHRRVDIRGRYSTRAYIICAYTKKQTHEGRETHEGMTFSFTIYSYDADRYIMVR